MADTSSNRMMDKATTVIQSQADMCQAYADGSVGVIVSGMIWLAAALIAHQYSANQAIWMLFFGGMFIFPISMLIGKLMGLSGKHAKGNQLGNLAMEGTIWMIMCLPLAFGLSMQQTEWFFQAMLLIIGGRYLTFSTIYGKKIYWILGAVLGIAAYALFVFKVQSLGSLLAGAGIEISFGLLMLFSYRRNFKRSLVLG